MLVGGRDPCGVCGGGQVKEALHLLQGRPGTGMFQGLMLEDEALRLHANKAVERVVQCLGKAFSCGEVCGKPCDG
jgi:hypothetical protein